MRIPPLLASLLIFAAIHTARAGDADPSKTAPGLEWPRFRGLNGAGLATAPHFPANLTASNLLWNVTLPGRGHSSPVVAGEKVFVTCTPPDTAKRILVALNPKDGAILWQQGWETPSFRQHADNSFTSGSPAVDAERVYVWWTSPEQSWFAALDQKDGREIWKLELGGFVSQHGAGSSPIVFEDSVILDFGQETAGPESSYTICVEAKTGKIRWKTPRQSASSTASTPCIFTPKGGEPQLILMSRTAGLTSLNPRTGAQNWELHDLMPKRCVASPIVTPNGLIVAQCGEGTAESFVYAVRPAADGKSAEKMYEVVRVGGYVPTPIAMRDRLFLWKENGLVTCLNSSTHEQLWSERVEGPFYGSPICLDDRLYAMTRRGDLVVLSASDRFEQIERLPLGEGSFAAPCVAEDRMYLRTFTHLICAGK